MYNLKVIIAEADTLRQKLYTDLINKEEGYSVLKSVFEAKELYEELSANRIDLVILNFNLKNFVSLKTFETLRSEFLNTEYIVIFEKETPELEHEMLKYGVFKYFISPFSFEALSQTLKDYRIYHTNKMNELGQEYRDGFEESEKKCNYWANNKSLVLSGLNVDRLDNIETFLKKNPDTYSAREIGSSLGFSLATARRHLEFLVEKGRIEVKFTYKRRGRPEKRYSTMLI